MRDRESALGEFGEQRLNVAQARFAGRGIAHVTDARPPGELVHDLVAVEIAGDVAHRPVRMEMLFVEAGDPRCFLAAVLQSVQSKRDEACRIVGAPDAENAALLAQLVVVEGVGRQHGPYVPRAPMAAFARDIGCFAEDVAPATKNV